jgi:hypothetical protein
MSQMLHIQRSSFFLFHLQVVCFMAPTVALCEQQQNVIATALPVSVGLISGALQPEQWKNSDLWKNVLVTHRVVVTTPQVLLDGLRHGYISLACDIALLVFDEAHHAADKHPYNLIMREGLPERDNSISQPDTVRSEYIVSEYHTDNINHANRIRSDSFVSLPPLKSVRLFIIRSITQTEQIRMRTRVPECADLGLSTDGASEDNQPRPAGQ